MRNSQEGPRERVGLGIMLTGKPGCGKTRLASLIKRLLKENAEEFTLAVNADFVLCRSTQEDLHMPNNFEDEFAFHRIEVFIEAE